MRVKSLQIRMFVALACLPFGQVSAQAAWAVRPIHIAVISPAGGVGDFPPRLDARIVVDKRARAGGTFAALEHAPYRGSPPLQADLVGGATRLGFDPMPDHAKSIRAGRLRAFAVSAPGQNPMLPDVPTLAWAGIPNLIAENCRGCRGLLVCRV